MEASSKFLTVKTDSLDGEWTIVLPRRDNRKMTPSRTMARVHDPRLPVTWAPSDSEIDPKRESKLKEKVQICMDKLEGSKFFRALLDQIESPKIACRFRKALGSDSEMKMVVYGIGSIESYENPRPQLALALLLKRKLGWIGDVEVFDPVLSGTESRVLESLGFSVLSINEEGRRKAVDPTMFFMPHCEAELYDNLLQENWRGELLNNCVLFGNSFEHYRDLSEFKFKNSVIASARHLLSVGELTDEFRIEVAASDDYFRAFHDSSWHFFSPDVETELPFLQVSKHL